MSRQHGRQRQPTMPSSNVVVPPPIVSQSPYDSLRRNYRPLPSCQEILSANAAGQPTSNNIIAQHQHDTPNNRIVVNRFITNQSAVPNQFDEQPPRRRKSSSVNKHGSNPISPGASTEQTRSSPPQRQQRAPPVVVDSAPVRHTVISLHESSKKPTNYTAHQLQQHKPNLRTDSPAPFAVRLLSVSSSPAANNDDDNSNNSRTFPTEASFLLAEETALLTTTTTTHTTSSSPKLGRRLGRFTGGAHDDGVRLFAQQQQQHINQWQPVSPSAVDINQLSLLSPQQPATRTLLISNRTPTPTSLSNTNTSSPRPTTLDDALSDYTTATNSEYDDDEDDDTEELDDTGLVETTLSAAQQQQQQQVYNDLLDDYYCTHHTYSEALVHGFSQHHQQQQPHYAPNISALAQHHERQRVTTATRQHNSNLNDNFSATTTENQPLQPYEESFQQLLHAFEQKGRLVHTPNNSKQPTRHTFVGMDGQTHVVVGDMVEIQHRQPTSSKMLLAGSDELRSQPVVADRAFKVKSTTTTTEILMADNNNTEALSDEFAVVGPTTAGSFQNISLSMLNIESSLNRLNEGAATNNNNNNVATAAAGSSRQFVVNQRRLLPNGGTSQSYTEHQQLAGKYQQNAPARGALITKMWSSLCLDPLFPKQQQHPRAAVTLEIPTIAANTTTPAVADPWEIPFDAIKNLEWRGAGAQGAVFVGTLAGQKVAVKKVCTRREVEEIRPFRRLQHPNIIRLLGVCTQELCYSIVMEYCQFGSLYDYIQQHNRIRPAQLLAWTKQIAAGMHYLHTNKIIHRDLKSPNVLLSDNQTVKISDFGTSKFASTTTGNAVESADATGKPATPPPPAAGGVTTIPTANNNNNKTWSFVGTVSWMAPEVIRSEAQNEKVDTWAFGVIIWEMLFGLPPYPGVEDASAIMWGVGSEILTLPIPDNVPQGLRLLMLQCWSSKPRNRPTFKNIQIHLDIAAPDVLEMQPPTTESGDDSTTMSHHDAYAERQDRWREQILTMLHKEVDSALKHSPRVLKAQELAILEQRKKELRHAQDIRMHYERKLERANNLYLEMTTCMLQLEQRERELVKREQRLFAFLNKDGRTKLAKRRILKAMMGSSAAATTTTSPSAAASAAAAAAQPAAYRWAASAHTTPISHNNMSGAHHSTAAGNNNNSMSISLDRGIAASSSVIVNTTTMAANATMPMSSLSSNNKTIVARTIVKSKHRLPAGGVRGVQQTAPIVAASGGKNIATYNNNAPPDALFDDRPFRRSKRAIRGSNSSSASSCIAAYNNNSNATTSHVRRRRRIQQNVGDDAVPSSTSNSTSEQQPQSTSSAASGGGVAEISPDLFKGLPRRAVAAVNSVGASSNTTSRVVVADVGVQCRLLGTPLTLATLAAESVTLTIVNHEAASSSNRSAAMISEEDVVDGAEIEQNSVRSADRTLAITLADNNKIRNDDDDIKVFKLDNDDEHVTTATSDEDDVDCVVPNDDDDDDDNHDLSDREHQVSVMRQRLSSGQMHLSLPSSSSSTSSSSSAESESEAASDATVSLSGPSVVVNAEDGDDLVSTARIVATTTRSHAENGDTTSSTAPPRATATDNNKKPIRLPGRIVQSNTTANAAQQNELAGGSDMASGGGEKCAASSAPTKQPFSDERPSGMFASDAARAATKSRTFMREPYSYRPDS